MIYEKLSKYSLEVYSRYHRKSSLWNFTATSTLVGTTDSGKRCLSLPILNSLMLCSSILCLWRTTS